VSGGFIEKLAGPLKATPYRIAITGHTWASKTPSRAGVRALELSADRANVIRQILEAEACLRPTSTPLRQGRHRSAVP
jgi:flagellar motor protein MotB